MWKTQEVRNRKYTVIDLLLTKEVWASVVLITWANKLFSSAVLDVGEPPLSDISFVQQCNKVLSELYSSIKTLLVSFFCLWKFYSWKNTSWSLFWSVSSMNTASQPTLNMSLCISAPLKSEKEIGTFKKLIILWTALKACSRSSIDPFSYFFRQTKQNYGYIFLMHCEFFF